MVITEVMWKKVKRKIEYYNKGVSRNQYFSIPMKIYLLNGDKALHAGVRCKDIFRSYISIITHPNVVSRYFNYKILAEDIKKLREEDFIEILITFNSLKDKPDEDKVNKYLNTLYKATKFQPLEVSALGSYSFIIKFSKEWVIPTLIDAVLTMFRYKHISYSVTSSHFIDKFLNQIKENPEKMIEKMNNHPLAGIVNITR